MKRFHNIILVASLLMFTLIFCGSALAFGPGPGGPGPRPGAGPGGPGMIAVDQLNYYALKVHRFNGD